MIRIHPMPPVMVPSLQQKFMDIDVATLGHRDGLSFAPRQIQSLDKHHKIAGRAITLSLVGRDSGLLHHAIGLCRAGDVLVIQAGDDVHACLGGGVGFAAKQQGILGAVIDGVATDQLELEATNFPVWCRGLSPLTTQSHGKQGSMNAPVNIGRAIVHAGDLVFADCSGVVFLEPTECNELIDWALEKIVRGEARRKAIKDGAIFGELTGASARVLKHLHEDGVN